MPKRQRPRGLPKALDLRSVKDAIRRAGRFETRPAKDGNTAIRDGEKTIKAALKWARSVGKKATSDFRRATPAENILMGRSAKARRYVLKGAKVTKRTPSISARQAETKRTRERYGFKTPEAATRARREGGLGYESRAQADRVAKAQETAYRKRLFQAGQKQQWLVEHTKTGEIKLRNNGRPRRFRASPDNASYVEQLRERKLAGEMLDQGDWFMMINYAEAMRDPQLSLLRASPGSRPDRDDDFEQEEGAA